MTDFGSGLKQLAALALLVSLGRPVDAQVGFLLARSRGASTLHGNLGRFAFQGNRCYGPRRMATEVERPEDAIRITFTGVDRPGITAELAGLLAEAGASLLDIEQVVVEERL